jgi:hypothetical protein
MPDGSARPVEYELESQDSKIVSVDGLGMTGMVPGRTLVTVRPIGLPASLGDLTTRVSVFVDPPIPVTPGGSRLVLTGPQRGTAGAPSYFRVELASDSGVQDLTNDGAALVLDSNRVGDAELRPGCVLVPKQSRAITVRARYKDLISNTLTLLVDPLSDTFRDLEVRIPHEPLVVGERRPYEVWGLPEIGGAWQNLTHLVGSEKGPAVRVLPPKVAEDSGLAVLAKSPGVFGMDATMGSLKSKRIDLSVSEAPLAAAAFISPLPPAVTISVGERTPVLRVNVVAPGGVAARAVDADWTSESEAIVAPVAGSPGVFEGKSPGRTRISGTALGQTTSVEINVTGNAFESVVVKKGSLEYHAENRISVIATVQATSDVPLEYRIVTVGGDGGDWKSVAPGSSQRFDLTTPPIRQGELNTRYHLEIEARDKDKRVIGRYPFSFKLETVVVPGGQ